MGWVKILGSVGVLALVGCAGPQKRLPKAPGSARPESAMTAREAALIRAGVVQAASSLVGSRRVVIQGKAYRGDCSGLVSGVYASQGLKLPISRAAGPRTGSVAQRMYLGATQWARIYRKGSPRPGDLIFFNNTYDANRDGRANDDVTHVGLVERVSPDGTVYWVHHSGGRVKRGRMNLARPSRHKGPDGRVLNDFLRRKRKGDSRAMRYLAGELFAGYAAVVP